MYIYQHESWRQAARAWNEPSTKNMNIYYLEFRSQTWIFYIFSYIQKVKIELPNFSQNNQTYQKTRQKL